MANIIFALECLGRASGVGLAVMREGDITPIFAVDESNPILTSWQLCQKLQKMSTEQKEPIVYQGFSGILFGCIRDTADFYLIGPFPYRELSRTELNEYSQLYHITDENVKLPRCFTMSQITAMVALAANIITGKRYSDDEILGINGLQIEDDETLLHDRIHHYILDEEREMYHHTHADELAILQCVKDGKVSEVQKRSLAADHTLGKLSRDELTHWKYAAVVAITLCARAAMDGGVSPATAYHFSDFYIRRLDDYEDIPNVIALRNKAVGELTDQVNQKKKIQVDGYVDQCMDYVSKHYREKIMLADIANGVGLSENYLSKLFAKATGMRLQDYIAKHRVNRSAGLLSHTEMSITDIAIYVGFPSQSYFGRVFKKYMGITPLKYRETHRRREFINQDDE